MYKLRNAVITYALGL